MFERETRREKILEARHREMKLKERTKSQQDGKVKNMLLCFLSLIFTDFMLHLIICLNQLIICLNG